MKLWNLYLISESIDYKIPGLIQHFYNNQDTLEIRKQIKELAELDPTRDYKYISWLVANALNNNIIMPEDAENIKQSLTIYHNFGGNKPKLSTPGELHKFIRELNDKKRM